MYDKKYYCTPNAPDPEFLIYIYVDMYIYIYVYINRAFQLSNALHCTTARCRGGRSMAQQERRPICGYSVYGIPAASEASGASHVAESSEPGYRSAITQTKAHT